MRTWAILGAILTFLAIWSGCTCKHQSEIAALATKYGEKPSHATPGVQPTSGAERAALSVALAGEKLTLSGNVPSEEARAQLLTEAKRLYGEGNIVDKTIVASVGKAAPEAWLTSALSALPWAKTVGFTVGEKSIALTGAVPTDKVKSDTVTLAKNTLGAGWTIEDRLRVGASGSATGTLLSEASDGKVALSGTLPSTDARDAVKRSAEKRLGADGFVESLKVAEKPSAVDPEWLAIAEKVAVWGKIAPVSLEEKTITLRGELPTESAKTARYGYVQKSVGDAWKVVDAMTVKSGSSAAPTPAAKANDTTPTNLEAFKGVEFETGSAEPTAKGKKLLDGAAKVMQTTGATRYEIAGHTDSRGNEVANLRLSESRAKAVLRYLVDKGVDEGRLDAKGYGATRPIGSNDSPTGLARNRRIEFTERK